MEGNPFAQLMAQIGGMIKTSARPAFRMGVVRSVSPLRVWIAGLDYSGAELLKNSVFDREETRLSAGDSVVCLPLDAEDARFFVLAKAVDA